MPLLDFNLLFSANNVNNETNMIPTDCDNESILNYCPLLNSDSLFLNFSQPDVIAHDVPIAEENSNLELVENVSFVDVHPPVIESFENVSIYYQNINRSKTKTSQLFLTTMENDYDAIVLVETNFDLSIRDAEIFDDRYLVYRCDRVYGQNSIKSSGGGIVIAVKKQFPSKLLITANKCEELWIKISLDDVDLILCGVYLPHSAPDDFCRCHIESVENISVNLRANDLVLICGDYNLSNLLWVRREGDLCSSNVNSLRETLIVDGMSTCDLGQINNFPNQYGVFLDLVYSNSPDLVNITLTDEPLLKLDRHHPAFILTCEVQNLKYTAPSNRIDRFDFKRAKIDRIVEHLGQILWPSLFLDNDIETCVSLFYEVIDECFNLYVPKITSRGSDSKYPWVDRELRNLSNKKNKAHACLKKLSRVSVRPLDKISQANFEIVAGRFCDLRSNFKVIHRIKYNQYIEKIEENIKNDPRSFFRYANFKRNSNGYPSSLFYGSQTARDTLDIANLFAKFFQSVYVEDLDPRPMRSSEIVDENSRKVSLIQFTEEAVEKAILQLDEQKGPGPDGISPFILKKIASILKSPLTALFNLSLASGVFPAIFCCTYI